MADIFMDQIDTLITARWVVPIEPAGCVLEDHAVAIHRGRIVAIEPAHIAAQRFAAQERIERRSHVLLPGFVNTHTHAAMTLLRGAAENPSFERWLNDQVLPLERRFMDPEYVRDGTDLAIADMLTSGTTCFLDMHLYPEVVAQSVSAAKMRACIGLPVVDGTTVWASSPDEYLEKGLRLHDEYRDEPLITTALAPYAPWAVSDATLERVRRLADELELTTTMHVNESSAEGLGSTESALARLERIGLLSPLFTAVHMVHVAHKDLERVARAGAHVAHCPQSNLKLGNGICPVPAMRELGINVTLGTDGAASNNELSMLDEMRTAALLASSGLTAGPAISAHQWLEISTLNGARALGLGDAIGSIVIGKWADLCCIDLDKPHTQPVHDVAAQLVYSVSRDQVSDVWVAGRALLTDRRLTTCDVAQLLERARGWQARIRQAAT
jgi:5-methylthioadenosine/S-adenosylhomocysteine deaminase